MEMEYVSPYLHTPARQLYDACREIGWDHDGKACAKCPVRDVCDAKRTRDLRAIAAAALSIPT
jgi:hypothetical protein